MADCGFSAIIVPTGRDPQSDAELWEYWVAKIKDIRAIVYDDSSNTVRIASSSNNALHINSVL